LSQGSTQYKTGEMGKIKKNNSFKITTISSAHPSCHPANDVKALKAISIMQKH